MKKKNSIIVDVLDKFEISLANQLTKKNYQTVITTRNIILINLNINFK